MRTSTLDRVKVLCNKRGEGEPQGGVGRAWREGSSVSEEQAERRDREAGGTRKAHALNAERGRPVGVWGKGVCGGGGGGEAQSSGEKRSVRHFLYFLAGLSEQKEVLSSTVSVCPYTCVLPSDIWATHRETTRRGPGALPPSPG